MKKIIYDCDNTMGIKNRDIDDGLALIYLLERKDVELLGITCTYGNSSIDEVYKSTLSLMKNLGVSNVPIYKGSGNFKIKNYVDLEFEKIDDEKNTSIINNEAASYIVDMVNKFSEEISILATGSMQNIYDAIRIDSSIINKIKEIVIMGGITEDLFFGNKKMNELNFSICNKGAFCVLKNMKNMSILTGNNCMKAKFDISNLNKIKKKCKDGFCKNEFIVKKIDTWMKEFKEMYDSNYIILWDVIAAIYLLEPQLFDDEKYVNNSTLESLKYGKLNLEPIKKQLNINKGANKYANMYINNDIDNYINIINIPAIRDSDSINNNLINVVFENSYNM